MAWAVVIVTMAAMAVVVVVGKECTNVPTQLSSHTVRAQLQADPAAPEWRLRELFLQHDHDHLNPTYESAWMGLMPPPPPRGLRSTSTAASRSEDDEFDWAMLYRSLKGQQLSGVASSFLEEVSLHDVRLDEEDDAVYGRAQRTNLEYLLLLDVDRLVWSFRTQAGLPAPGNPYGGWERADIELRGHFVGHYLSATAKMWASTHDAALADKMSAVVDALHECQQAAGTGYLSAFPSEFFDRFEAIKPVWAPYYTIHKHVVAGNGKALEMVVAMADYFAGRVRNVIQKYSIEQHWTSLNEETGGMNDVLYQLYTITRNQRLLVLAHLFDKPCFLGLCQEIATFFMDTVNSSHAYATGGTSVNEFWSDPKRLAGTLITETEESCTTYNMLKVSRHLFRWTKEIAYADYYERALINGVLSIQRGRDPGVMIYMLPQGPGKSKAVSYHGWGTQYDSFWCCYGTGIESFSKLGDSIYFEEKGGSPALYIIQFIPSTFNWRTIGLTVTQQLKPLSSSDQHLQVSFSISAKTNGQFATLNIRMPSWTSLSGAKATLNDKDLELASPGTFLTIGKQWGSGDHLSLQLPIHLRTEAIKEYASLQAVLFGPFLLAGLTTGDWDAKTGGAATVSDWITPIPPSSNSQLMTLVQESGGETFILSTANGSLTMQDRPESTGGTEAAVHATFRVVPQASGAAMNSTSAMIEPFAMPGMVITDKLTMSAEKSPSSLFTIVPGLDGAPGSVSLELRARPGCFLVTPGSNGYAAGAKVQVACGSAARKNGDGGAALRRAASFVRAEPLRRYHPISFAARGVRRTFLLEPLFTLRDEFYTIFFNLGA
ncbi:hypothetical protein PR202_gb27896 [Eleusine coracana subsp. coracana]|uniref:Uncharacterized protein n=1 Tax=Eleusine coracana subsp. coracana TaxID=191504 RepID=A0AAV5FW76_ELECO|nr:hypothetical protein PR202_gb27896 [Eleusine coracana subsp. coracana]